MVDVWRELKRNKEGIIIGALVGLAATVWLKVQGADMSFAIINPGLLDNTISSVAGVANLAQTKVGIALIGIFAAIGYVVDSLVYPRK